MKKRTIGKVVAAVLAAAVLLELVYIVAAKVMLKKLPELASYDALQITYADAGSWIPGRAWVKDFVVSGHENRHARIGSIPSRKPWVPARQKSTERFNAEDARRPQKGTGKQCRSDRGHGRRKVSHRQLSGLSDSRGEGNVV